MDHVNRVVKLRVPPRVAERLSAPEEAVAYARAGKLTLAADVVTRVKAYRRTMRREHWQAFFTE